MPTEISPGQFVENVGDILGDKPEVVDRILPARHPDQPEWPGEGIWFGLPEDDYHAINACSASGMKSLSISPMLHWSRSPLNLMRRDDDTDAKILGRAYHVRICEGAEAYVARYSPIPCRADYPDALVTMKQLRAAILEAGDKPRGTAKEQISAQLRLIEPSVQIWDDIIRQHAEDNEGLVLIKTVDHAEIEIAARMIELDHDISKGFTGGYPEVSIFFYDDASGAPCKARLDRLKLKSFTDLKSFSLRSERPVDSAVDYEIAARKHYIAVCHYEDAIEAAKRLIREHGASVVHGLEDPAWALKWAEVREPQTAFYVFQATGEAPITRGRIMHRGTVYTITQGAVRMLRRRYVEMTKAYGCDPWLDIAPIRENTDESIPMSATDFGDYS